MKGAAPALCLGAMTAAIFAAPVALARRAPVDVAPNPSAVIAAELAFARAAQERGQWTAFREAATKDAVMYVPQQVSAQVWLKERKDPPAAVRWQPFIAYVSCDGTTGVTTGAWQRPDGTQGYFTTVWRRDPKRGWQWILDHGDALKAPRPAPEMLTGKVATCPPRGRRGPGGEGVPPPQPSSSPQERHGPAAQAVPTPGEGHSPDGTLSWKMTVAPDLSRQLVVRMRQGEGEVVILTDNVGAPS
ncbi:hypothetical protein [Sphingobium aquiterrae]|uniref:hypothetical protein n=1 Tax=Sphingobium aquiterrae TaxID=2038656 RepID=UPI003015E431